MKYMFLPFARIFDYKGRSNRREYWLFQLIKVLCGILLASWLIFSGALTIAPIVSSSIISALVAHSTLLVASIVYLLCFLPAELALTVRRWHDIGNSGWTILVVVLFGMIPLIGFLAPIIHFAAMCWPGDKGGNQFGQPYRSDSN